MRALISREFPMQKWSACTYMMLHATSHIRILQKSNMGSLARFRQSICARWKMGIFGLLWGRIGNDTFDTIYWAKLALPPFKRSPVSSLMWTSRKWRFTTQSERMVAILVCRAVLFAHCVAIDYPDANTATIHIGANVSRRLINQQDASKKLGRLSIFVIRDEILMSILCVSDSLPASVCKRKGHSNEKAISTQVASWQITYRETIENFRPTKHFPFEFSWLISQHAMVCLCFLWGRTTRMLVTCLRQESERKRIFVQHYKRSWRRSCFGNHSISARKVIVDERARENLGKLQCKKIPRGLPCTNMSASFFMQAIQTYDIIICVFWHVEVSVLFWIIGDYLYSNIMVTILMYINQIFEGVHYGRVMANN